MGLLRYEIEPQVADAALDVLFDASWPNHKVWGWSAQHAHSLTFICAFDDARLIGYVNVAWDGGWHAFLLEPTVHPDVQHQGIGTELVRRACAIAKERGLQWMHVDFEERLQPFYDACGFSPTAAGLIRLNEA